MAREFAENGIDKGDLCLIGEEPDLPYERPALSKAVLVNESVRLPGFHTSVGGGGERQDVQWYASHGIVTKLGDRVVSVDAASRTLETASGDTIQATEALLLATGAAPIQLSMLDGSDLSGIYYLRDNAQAIVLYEALSAAKGKTVIVVGGGYIGLEVAAAAITVGCKVKMIFPEGHVMSRLFTPKIAQHYEKVYSERGVEFLKNGAVCKAFLGDDTGKVRGVRYVINNIEGDVEGDVVVVGVGARANTQLFRDQLKLDERGGVIVDSQLRTSAPGVYAIGDIATFPLKMYGDRPARMEHVQNARESAKHAVASILGSSASYDYLPYFYSRVFDLSWKFYGDSTGEVIVVGDFKPKLLAAWVQDSVVQGVFMESASDEDTAAMQNIARIRPKIDVAKLKSGTSAEEALAEIAAFARPRAEIVQENTR